MQRIVKAYTTWKPWYIVMDCADVFINPDYRQISLGGQNSKDAAIRATQLILRVMAKPL